MKGLHKNSLRKGDNPHQWMIDDARLEVIQQIRAEVERQAKSINTATGDFAEGRRMEQRIILSLLDTLQEKSEKPINVWSNTPIKAKVKETGKYIMGFTDGKGHLDIPVDHNSFLRYNIDELEFDTLQEQPVKDFPTTEKEMQDFLATHERIPVPERLNSLERILKEQPVCDGLEEEIKRYTEQSYHDTFNGQGTQDEFDWDDIAMVIEDTARHFAQWQKEQMMRSAVEGTYNNSVWGTPCIDLPSPLELERFDKVRIIIVKEEGK